MNLDQEAVSAAIVELSNTQFMTRRAPDLEEQYNDMLEYLKYSWSLDAEDADIEDVVLRHMQENGLTFWGPLPNESSAIYEHFMLYLQLPAQHRSAVNVARVRDVALNGGSIRTAKHSISATKDKQLFWEARADLYDRSFMESLTSALHDNQRGRIAAMRSSSLTIADLGRNMATQMLIGASKSFENTDWENLSPNQLVNVIGAASKLAVESNKLGESALMLTELMETIEELESISEEELAFLEAKVVSKQVKNNAE